MFSRERWKEGKSQQLIPHYYGLLSTYAEWHSLGIGFYHGFSESKKVPSQVLHGNPDVQHEPHMAKIGFPIGVLAKYGMVVVGFKYGVDPIL